MGHSWIGQFYKNQIYINCTRFKKKKIQKQKNIMKSNSDHMIIIYLLLRKTKDSYYMQYFEDNKKNIRIVRKPLKG